MRKNDLPEIDEIVFAVSEAPLGEGAEAQVFKIHTNPNFTVRKRLTDMPINELAAALKEAEPVMRRTSSANETLRRRWLISTIRNCWTTTDRC